MVDVVQQLDVRRVHGLHHLHSPGGVVAHVVFMIHLAVEQFQADDNAVVLGNLLDPIESHDRILGTLFVRHAGAVSGERDHVRHSRLGCQRNVLA